MVIVNTVVLVQAEFRISQLATALALAAFGGGSMAAALALPRLLDNVTDRTAMLTGAVVLVVALSAGTLVSGFRLLPLLWLLLALGCSLTLTPSGRLLRRSSSPEDRPALFAAQFALSHVCRLITYRWLGRPQSEPAASLCCTCVNVGRRGVGSRAAVAGARSLTR